MCGFLADGLDRGFARKTRIKTGGSAFAGPLFLFCGGGAFFQGDFGKNDVFVWCFCGEVVVSCW